MVTKLTDIFSMIGIILLLGIASLSLYTLSPQYLPVVKQSNILGVSDTKLPLQPQLVGGKHNIIADEKLSYITEDTAIYKTKLRRRAPGQYSKPIIYIPKGVSNIIIEPVLGNLEHSQIYLQTGNSKIEINKQQQYRIPIDPTTKNTIFLILTNDVPINFTQQITFVCKYQ